MFVSLIFSALTLLGLFALGPIDAFLTLSSFGVVLDTRLSGGLVFNAESVSAA